ncbi:glycosyltransferase family 2 protein [Desulfobacter vibrioformis]|uniref:glycosyltransferase family 2 protein n=1 Tax=Desulfobacter vibrioformis TaxID=34031 RepID=UPI000551BC8E|nr:glycosyltransferase family 2 protein [Desulfobacter vibrioformis]
MKISIVTVVYNNKASIQNAMDSVLSQEYDDIEYIIVDGSSTDGTVEVIKEAVKKYPEGSIKFISEKDDGIYDAMNKGIGLTTGDVVGLLNSDDVYADNLVLKKIAGIFANPSIDICYADLVYVDKFNLNKVIRYWKSCDYRDGLLRKGWVPPHPTFFVSRKIYDKYGMFDLDYKLASDFELMVRFLGKYKIPSVYIPNVLVKMRLGGTTNKNIKNIIKQNLEIYRAGKKNNVHISPLSLTFKKGLNRIIQFVSKPIKEVQ